MDWLQLALVAIGLVAGGLVTWLLGEIQTGRLKAEFRRAVEAKIEISLLEEFLMTELLAERIRKEFGAPDIIFAISPGGGMIAEWLSRRFLGTAAKPIEVRTLSVMNKRMRGDVASATVSPRAFLVGDDEKQKKVLLVNDTVRSGLTEQAALQFLLDHFNKENVADAVLVSQVDSCQIPRFSYATTTVVPIFHWKNSTTVQQS